VPRIIGMLGLNYQFTLKTDNLRFFLRQLRIQRIVTIQISKRKIDRWLQA
jgi:hypothetical protein